MSWRTFLARSAIGAAMVGIAVFAGVRLATADPGGPTRDALTFAGVLRERASTTGNTLTFVFRKGTASTPACTATTLPFAIDASGAFSVTVPLGGCADPRGLFDGDSVVYDVRIGSATGDLLASDVAVTPVPYARFADQVGANNDCPAGYSRASESTTVVVCRRVLAGGAFDELVKVGTGATAFWIDRYEASVWTTRNATSGTQIFRTDVGDFPGDFPPNGQGTGSAYAISLANVVPANGVSWFQANEACAGSGKRLPTGSEWLRAARGTVDPPTPEAGDSGCRTSNLDPRFIDRPRVTGLGATYCRSTSGAQDMIGNVSEWTSEWFAAPGIDGIGSTNTWADYSGSGSSYGRDFSFNIASQALGATAAVQGLPSAAVRGGHWGDGDRAGIFTVDLRRAPTSSNITIGFRCVVPR